MTAYYNEIDPYAAQWLRNLIAKGHLPKGDVDERSIVDVRPDDLRPYRGGQCHFFAGIGGWPYALRLAGWPDDKPVWTGSCPCQPLSVAGKRQGHADERHLWPAFYRLITECRPAAVFGEQVASKDGREWLSAVRADLEAIGYACGCADMPAASVGAPHIRQRLWWVGHSECERSGRDTRAISEAERGIGVRTIGDDARPSSAIGELADDDQRGRQVEPASWLHADGASRDELVGCGAAGELADPEGAGLSQRECNAGTGREADGASQGQGSGENSPCGAIGELGDSGSQRRRTQRGQSKISECSSAGPWSDLIWLPCADGKARPTQPGLFPLVDRSAFRLGAGGPFEGKSRVGMLRAAGNAIVPQTAAAFIDVAMEVISASKQPSDD